MKFRTIAFAPILILLTGCGTPDYRTYTNTQNIFPGTTGSFVQMMNNGIPIYTDNVDKPYVILGEVDLSDDDPRKFPRALSKIVKSNGGDAGIIRNSRIFNTETKSGQLFLFPNGSGFSTADKTIYHYTASGYVIAFRDLIDLELADVHGLVTWLVANTNGGVINGVSYSPAEINAAQYKMATNFQVWLKWCEEHPTGGTFTDSQGKTINVPAEKIPPIRLALLKEADKLKATFKNRQNPP